MANYVKFIKGTPNAFKNLRVKNEDTLYFIVEPDDDEGLLYLGNKLIAGGDCDGHDKVALSELTDVLIDNNIDTSTLLMFDPIRQKWINQTLDNLVFVGATADSNGVNGLVPSPKKG